MPKYSYDTYADLKKETSNNKPKERKVGYFKLQPGEEAIVRFAYAEPKEFDICTVHEVKVQDKFRTVLCLRNAKEPIETCPLCAQGTALKARFYVKLLHYVVDDAGNVKVVPEVANWAKKYADVLRARFIEYGDLKDNLFKITRIGTGMETSYDIQYANPVKYSEANGYVKDFSAFDDFDLAHHSYAEKTREEIEEFLQTGEFPLRTKEQKESITTTTVTSPVPSDDDIPVPTNSIQQPNTQTITDSSDFTTQRPRRTYDIQ